MRNAGTGAFVLIASAGLFSSAFGARTITAAGATFPYPIYAKWFQIYKERSGGIQINYQSIGSGGGIKQLMEGTVDFGASDKPMSDHQLAAFKVKPLHFPTVVGAVVPIYNVDGVTAELKFTGPLLAGIFLGKIKQWNDPAIAALNPGVKLPNQDIVIVVRSDGSGTTFVFTDYLSKTSPEWRSKIGANAAVNWPVGLRQKGNEGVAGFVKLAPNSIGYVELTFAATQHMLYGAVQNHVGRFMKATLASVSAAAASAVAQMPDDFRVSITDALGEDAYPISTFTWLLIPGKIEDLVVKEAVTGFLRWMLTSGQQNAAALNYAPLPAEVVAKELQAIGRIQ